MIRDEDITNGNRPVSLRGYDARVCSDITGIDTGSETLVQQQFASEVDINTIVRRFGITRGMPLGVAGDGLYGDFTEITDYESALERVRKVREGFMKLPAEVRDRFNNDPNTLIKFAQNISVDDLSYEAPPVEAAESPPGS